MTAASLAVPTAERTHGLRHRYFALAALVGSLIVVSGTLLPWITLYAGLHTFRGVQGLYGKLLLCGALLAGVCAVRALCVSRSLVARKYLTLSSGLGVLLLGATMWLVRGLVETTSNLVHDPVAAMTVPRSGAGLFVCLAGAIALVIASLLGRMSDPSLR